MSPLLAALLLAAFAPASEPAAIPSGMDLLYGDRVTMTASGEPVVTIGLMSKQTKVTLSAETTLWVDFYDAGVHKRSALKPGDALAVTLARATPATRRWYVDLQGVRFGDRTALERALGVWKTRGHASVHAVEEGVVLGVGGKVVDNREYRLVLEAKSQSEAQALSRDIFRRFATRTSVRARLAERPWGELALAAGGLPLGLATSYVRVLAAGGLVQVDDVEHGKGYAWHGREPRSFRGELYVVVDPDGTLAVVNVLGAELVLEGVVPAEMFASAHPEALKAQAVAARNHLLSKLGRRHHEDPYLLCSEQHCQVYAGTSREDARTSAAVRDTAGEALFHHGELVEAVYSASCGGHTDDNDAVWGDAPSPSLRARPDFDVDAHPELARFAGAIAPDDVPAWVASSPDSYCARATQSKPEKIRWTRSFSQRELADLLAPEYARIGALRDVKVNGRGRGGRVVGLELQGSAGAATVLYELPIRKLFQNLRSGAFTLKVVKDAAGAVATLTFEGAGWGHGVGMCQLGAVGRAEAGRSYRQILSHYYNEATPARLYEGRR